MLTATDCYSSMLHCIYLIDGSQVPKESFSTRQQSLVVRTHHHIGNISLRTEGVQQQLLPVGQDKR